MATKVEEERELLVKAIGCYDVFGDHKVSLGMNGMIDSLIAAARGRPRRGGRTGEEQDTTECASAGFQEQGS